MSWWTRLTHRGHMEAQLDKEVAFHLAELAAEFETRGHTPAEAHRLARLELGGPAQVKEDCRDARGTRWVEDLLADIRYAIRTLRQRPGFASIALLSLALGTGATTVMFSLIDGVMLKPFAYHDPGQIVRLWEQTNYSTPGGNLWAFSNPNYLDCKAGVQALDMAAWSIQQGTLSVPGDPETVNGLYASSNLLPMLGVAVGLGRGFRAEEDHLGAEPVALIADRVWRARFGGSRQAIGAHLVFDGQPYTVIGVMPADFRLDDGEVDVITPAAQNKSPAMQRRRSHGFQVWARLRPGATLAQARSELSSVGTSLAAQYPDTNKGRTFIADPLKPDVGDTKTTLLLLLGAVSLVLLIACSNIASLLLARAVSRERELAMRVALGASRSRLVRQCLTESAVLALAGGAIGVVLAAIGLRPFALLWPGGLPRVQEVQVNWHVLAFAFSLSLVSGLLFGLAPAVRAPARHLDQTLRSSSRSLAGGAHRLHGVFVVSEISIAVVLLVSAGLLGRTMQRLSALDPGIDIHNVLTARTALSPTTLADPAATRTAWRLLLEQAQRVPGVVAVAMVDTVPMREGSNPINYSLTPAEIAYDDKNPAVLANSVTADYLKVAGIPLREGRFLTDNDRQGTEPVAVIDDVMARQAFPHEDPIGRHLWLGIGTGPVTVVGVVGHVRQWGLAADDQSKIRAQLYYPFAQVPDGLIHRWSDLMSIAVRTSVEPMSVIEPLRKEIRGITGDQVIYQINTFESLAAASLARQRFLLLLFAIFAGLALLLACIGIYGVLAYLTGQRVPEIGMRIALGATAPQVMWMVLRQSLAMILAGIVLGAAGSWFATRSIVRLVAGVQSAEPSIFLVMIAVLMLAALFASFLPARKASRVDPMRALRQE